MTEMASAHGERTVTEGIPVSHVGVCVTDYERSLRFYTEGLGFEPVEGRV